MQLTRVAIVLVLGGCTSAPGATDAASPRPSSPSGNLDTRASGVRVTRDDTTAPLNCTPGNVGRRVTGFFEAVNRGDVAAIMGTFTKKNGWYSVTEGDPRNGGRHFVAYRPAKLRSYFKERIRQRERMHLVEIDVEYDRSDPNLGHVAYTLIRSADDLGRYAKRAVGKGAIDCRSGQIAVWSMAQGQQPVPGDLCPGEPDPPQIAIACGRAEADF